MPHIYARTEDHLFAQGYMAARDRLFQLDLWGRQGTGKLAEVLGPDFVERDRAALLLRSRMTNRPGESGDPDSPPLRRSHRRLAQRP